jgi:hypothetical protein
MGAEEPEEALRAQLLRDAHAALVGGRIASAKLGVGSVLMFDFVQDSEGPPEVWLLVECSWRLETADRVLVGSADDRIKLRECIERLEGSEVVDVRITLPACDMILKFSGNQQLTIFPTYADNEDYENWTLRLSLGTVFTLGPGRRLVLSRAD